MKKFKRIFLHCSDSEWGTSLIIDSWHRARGWKKVGYHIVILNGYPTADWFNKGIIIPHLEGSVEIGRPIDSDQWFESFEKGAGVYGWNEDSFHICIIGKKVFSEKVFSKTIDVVTYWRLRLEIPINKVYGHYEKTDDKSCPNIDMGYFRKRLKEKTTIIPRPIEPKKEIANKSIFQLFLDLIHKGRKNA